MLTGLPRRSQPKSLGLGFEIVAPFELTADQATAILFNQAKR
jgi:hypothetical protein